MRSSHQRPVKDLAHQLRDARIHMAFSWNALRKGMAQDIPDARLARELADAIDHVAKLAQRSVGPNTT